jgi:hypothetical protein
MPATEKIMTKKLWVPLVVCVLTAACGAGPASRDVPDTDTGEAIVLGTEEGVVLNVKPGFPEVLPDGRVRTRYEVRAADGDPWKYRCFQPDRFVDLSDPVNPVYEDADWPYIEFDVIEPVSSDTNSANWLVLVDSGGSSIALEQNVTEGLDANDHSTQDLVIMPWPGSLMAEDCSGTPEHCRLKTSSTSADLSKLNEGGFWRAKADNEWRGEQNPYQGFPGALQQNRLVQFVRRQAPDWGFVQFSGCARDNSGGDRSLGPHRDRDPWGYEAVRAGLSFVHETFEPASFFFTGLSSGGVNTLVVGSRLGDAPFVEAIKGYVPDSGAADFTGFLEYKDRAHENNGWLWVSELDAHINCASVDWSMSDVLGGVLRKAVGLRAQDRLASTRTGSCPGAERGEPCYDAPVFFASTVRDTALVCGSDEMFDAVYRPAWDTVSRLRLAGESAGHGFFLDEIRDMPDLALCLNADLPTPECADPPPESLTVGGDGHTLSGVAEFQQAALDWMRCVLAASDDPEALNACARNCRRTSEGTTCLCGEADEPCG